MIEDKYLIEKIKAGNYAAFNLLIKRYQTYVFSILVNLLKNKQDAEEAFQDTFMKIYRSLESYNYEANFGTWAYRIAYNTGLDYLRKRKRNVTRDLKEAPELYDHPDLDVEKQDLRKKLDQFLSLLSEEDEQLIRLYYLRELSISEVGEITGISNANIKTKLFRSRKKLLELMHDEDIVDFKKYYHGQ